MVSSLSILERTCLSGLARQGIVAVDPGRHSIKLLRLEKVMGRIQPGRTQSVSVEDEGLLTAEETYRQVQVMFSEGPPEPIALTLAQEVVISQVVDLPATRPEDVRRAIEEETLKLVGLTDSPVIFDYVRLKPFGKRANPYWVTFCREREVLDQIQRLGDAGKHVFEVTSPANALWVAYREAHPDCDRAVLVDIGSSSTVVVVILEGQATYASTFAVGGHELVQEIAKVKGVSPEGFEPLRADTAFFVNPKNANGVRSLIDRWYGELQKLVWECAEDNPDLNVRLSNMPVVLSGGASHQAGMVDYLRQKHLLNVSTWRDSRWEDAGADLGSYVIAWGAGLQALAKGPRAASLLPVEARAERDRQRLWLHTQVVAWALIALFFIVSIGGTLLKIHEGRQKSHQLFRTRAALRSVGQIEQATLEVSRQYERLRPILLQQQRTLDTLATLKTLRRARADKDLWFALFADQQSFLSAATNAPPSTNAPAAPAPTTVETALTNEWDSLNSTNFGFIAAVCLREEGEAMRNTLSKLVTELKQEPLFRRVDTLSSDRHKSLLDPKVLIPDRSFALTLEITENDFLPTLPVREPLLSTPASKEPRRPERNVPTKAVRPALNSNP